MQASKPRPNLTFTYAAPVEMPRPDYRMVLVFDAANDLTAARVCAGQIWHKPPLQSRPFNVFAVDVSNASVRRITDTNGGAQFPELSSGGTLD